VSELTRLLDIQIEVPESASEESLTLARLKAKEAIVVVLQQRGELTIREAAAELGLSYESYLELLAQAGLPATTSETDPGVLSMFRSAGQPQ
jgi:DNA-directed RNA polymerase specialized sigma24 family protein